MMEMKKITVIYADGRTEEALVPVDGKANWISHLTTAHMIVGIIGTAMLAYFTYLQLTKKR